MYKQVLLGDFYPSMVKNIIDVQESIAWGFLSFRKD
jgi:hypothetical protein